MSSHLLMCHMQAVLFHCGGGRGGGGEQGEGGGARSPARETGELVQMTNSAEKPPDLTMQR